MCLSVLVSRNQQEIVIVRYAKGMARESLVCVSVCGVKVIAAFIFIFIALIQSEKSCHSMANMGISMGISK